MSESLITKKALAAAVKELMSQRSFSKISVSDIVAHCGLNRQTFYYHFKDKYDLVNWIYYDEVVSAILQNGSIDDWNGIIRQVLLTMEKDKSFYIEALSIAGQNAFQEYLFEMTKKLLCDVVEALDSEGRIPPGDKEFIAEFCTHGLVGIIVSWAKSGMKEPPDQIADHLGRFIDDSTIIAIQGLKSHSDGERQGK